VDHHLCFAGQPEGSDHILQARERDSLEPTVSVEVEDVDQCHGDATAAGYRIVYPLTDEP